MPPQSMLFITCRQMYLNHFLMFLRKMNMRDLPIKAFIPFPEWQQVRLVFCFVLFFQNIIWFMTHSVKVNSQEKPNEIVLGPKCKSALKTNQGKQKKTEKTCLQFTVRQKKPNSRLDLRSITWITCSVWKEAVFLGNVNC